MTFRERLTVPISYWVIAAVFGLSTVTGATFALGDAIAVPSTLLAIALIAWALIGYGSIRVGADQSGVRAGSSLLEWPYVGEVEVLDEAATRHRLGPGADHAAFLAVRPYVRRSLLIRVRDHADPHPYWLVSTRRPIEFAQVIGDARARAEALR